MLALAWGCKGTPQDTSITPTDECLDAEPGVVYTLSGTQLDALGKGGRITMQTLQGIVNREQPSMFMAIDSGDSHDSQYLDLLSREYGLVAEPEQDELCYLYKFRDQIEGYVLFQNTQQSSANAAVTVAAATNAIAIDLLNQDMFKYVEEELALEQIADVREWDAKATLESSYMAQMGPGMVMQEYFSGPEAAPRDFAVSRRIPSFFEDTRDAGFPDLYADVWARLGPGDPVYGWSVADLEGQNELVGALAGFDLSLKPTGTANNLSVFQHYALRDKEAIVQPEMDPPPEDLDDLHLVAFVMGGGQNLGQVMGRMTNEGIGHFVPVDSYPVGWTLSAMVLDLAPPVAEWMYSQAGGDNWFLMAPGGEQFTYPSLLADRSGWAERTAAEMQRMDQRVLAVLDRESAWGTEPLQEILGQDQVDAVFWAPAEGEPDEWEASELLWSNGKPIVPMLPVGFDPDVPNTLAELEDFIPQVVDRADDDLSDITGYTLIYADLDGTRLADFATIEAELEAQEEELDLDFRFEVLRPDQLLTVLRENIPAE